MSTTCGLIALIGPPNAGKSTLVNQLTGSKVSIVSRKPQTTRFRVMGIVQKEEAQLIFVDTPGIFTAKNRFDNAMVEAAWSGVKDADITLLLVDAQKGIDSELETILKGLQKRQKKVFLALNKIDRVEKTRLLELSQKLFEREIFQEVFMISALSGSGVEKLLDSLKAILPEGPWLFPDDQLSDMPLRLFAAEITREQVFNFLHAELPYAAMVETEAWEEKRDGSVKISQSIIVQRDSQKGIVIGKAGSALRRIGQKAREEMEAILECRVHLFLNVKVRENWREDPNFYSLLGLEFRQR